jgi:hypothetical protein
MKARARNLVLVVVVLALWGMSASAAIIEIGLTAEITYIDPYDEWLNEQFDIGDIITGSYTYDSSTPDSLPSTQHNALYWHYDPPFGVYLNANNWVFQTDPEDVQFLVAVANRTGGDNYLIRSLRNLHLSNGFAVSYITWQLDDFSGTALSSTDLPTTPPLLKDWEQVYGLTVQFGSSPWGGPIIRGMVTSVWLVPEPSTLLLIILGSLVLVKSPKVQGRY